MTDRPDSNVSSPCISVCVLDLRTNHCLGCLRTRGEIAGWLDYTDEERLRVLKSIERRRAAAV
jgi:hypothetical protein